MNGFGLEGQVALVTGAGQGNGKAIAVGLARQGVTVSLGDMDKAAAELAAAEIVDAGGEAAAFELDVRNLESCQMFADQSREHFSSASILVNNAGILRRSTMDDESFEADWRNTLETNLDGTRHMVSATLAQLRETRGRIINIASIRSFTAAGGLAAYSVSKGAIAQLTKSLAVDLANDGIRVNALAPGAIATSMTIVTRENPQVREKFLAHTPMGRIGEPDELVGPVLFLASEHSSYVTGVILPVDGGYLAV